MFAALILFVKALLVPLHTKPPTAEAIQAFEDYEDERGCYDQYPSPQDIYEYDVEWRDGMLELPLWTLLRWRLAVAWMPFCRGERRLVGEWASRRLFPDLWGQRRKVRTKRAEKKRKVKA